MHPEKPAVDGLGDDEAAALVNVRDVTERERLERTYRELFENVADGLVIHDPDTGEILDVNKRFCELNGYSRSNSWERRASNTDPSPMPIFASR